MRTLEFKKGLPTETRRQQPEIEIDRRPRTVDRVVVGAFSR